MSTRVSVRSLEKGNRHPGTPRSAKTPRGSGTSPPPVTEGGNIEPVPGLDPESAVEARPLLYRLDVDGEVFNVRPGRDGGTNYDWVSGRNEGYGFGSSASPDLPEECHRESIRNFLTMIDPQTGYLEDN